MTTISCILPCYGRHEQTLSLIPRLLRTAGPRVKWELIAVCGSREPQEFVDALDQLAREWNNTPPLASTMMVAVGEADRLSYWQALSLGQKHSDAPLLANLANDLIPGHGWLQRALDSYRHAFGEQPALMGFNGDSHGEEHACHFIIHQDLLDRFGGWPVWYDHNFGDTELCLRARELGLYAKSPWSMLFHDHPWISLAGDDEVYLAGRAKWEADQLLFGQRRANQWR